MADLKAVDQLNIKILVDNNIERFSALPEGYKDETAHQLTSNPPIDHELTGLPFLDLENFCCGAHGLAFVVTTTVGDESFSILFDTGPDSRTFARNAAGLKMELKDISTLVLSHWHADHSGGVITALDIMRSERAAAPTEATKTVVDLHPARPVARASAPAPAFIPKARQVAPPTFEEITTAGGVVSLHAEPHTVSGGQVFVSGEIPRVTEWETGFLGGVEWNDVSKAWEKEKGQLVMDERYIAVNVRGKGLVVFSACSHAGIVNVLKDVQDHFPGVPVHTVLGGLHLGGVDMKYRIAPTVDYLASMDPRPKHVLPLHCTGFDARVALRLALGEVCLAGGVGMNISIQASP